MRGCFCFWYAEEMDPGEQAELGFGGKFLVFGRERVGVVRLLRSDDCGNCVIATSTTSKSKSESDSPELTANTVGVRSSGSVGSSESESDKVITSWVDIVRQSVNSQILNGHETKLKR
eukprot:m.101647 g.101647  ORF g.101647 m.101647 type:complete len:118 (-) comp27339_c0_seq3:209-562(-)